FEGLQLPKARYSGFTTARITVGRLATKVFGSTPSERYAILPLRSRTSTVGKGCPPSRVSSPSANTSVPETFSFARSGATRARPASLFSAKKTISLDPLKSCPTESNRGSASRQGPHHVAQKSNTTTFPRSSDIFSGALSPGRPRTKAYGSFAPEFGSASPDFVCWFSRSYVSRIRSPSPD